MTAAAIAAGWGFVHPALLGGLGLALVPVLIHLLSRRRFRRLPWGAMRFLLEAERQSRRRVRFEQWLLLALRCAAMVLLALLLARPFVRPGVVASLLGGRSQVQRIILLDDSASLGYVGPGGMEFATLREAAARLLNWFQQEAPDDPVSIYLTSRPRQPLAVDERVSPARALELRSALERLRPGALRADPQQAFQLIAAQLALAGRSTSADVYVLSDFQRSDWIRGESEASVFHPLEELSGQAVRVVLVASAWTGRSAGAEADVRGGVGPQRDNLAIIDARLERTQTIAGFPAIVRATLGNYSGQTRRDIRIQPLVDGVPAAAATLEELEPGREESLGIEVVFPTEGWHELALTLTEADGLPADDVRRVGLGVRPALSVLVVNGRPSADPLEDSALLVRHALSPPGPFSSGLRVQVIDAGELEATELEAYDCVLLCDLPAPAARVVALLEHYVRAGGGLVIFLGPQTGAPDDYNRLMHADGAGLLPLPLLELREHAPEHGGVGLLRSAEHPLTSLFPQEAGLSESARFHAYYRCGEPPTAPEPRPGGPAAPRVLARYADAERSAALVERSFGRGRVLLFTSSANLEWNDWPRAPDGSFVVALLEMVHHVARPLHEPASFLAGQTLRVSLPAERYQPLALFRAPDHPATPAFSVQARGPQGIEGPLEIEGPAATVLGVWRVELTPLAGPPETRPLGVNLDPRESDLTVASPAQCSAAVGSLAHEFLPASEALAGNDDRARRELWPAILIVLAGVLMIEQALAWWFAAAARVRREDVRFTAVSALPRQRAERPSPVGGRT